MHTRKEHFRKKIIINIYIKIYILSIIAQIFFLSCEARPNARYWKISDVNVFAINIVMFKKQKRSSRYISHKPVYE